MIPRQLVCLALESLLAAAMLTGVVALRDAYAPLPPSDIWVLSGGDASAASEFLDADADSRALWMWVTSEGGLNCFHEPDVTRPISAFYVSLRDYWGAGTPERPTSVTLARTDPAWTEWELFLPTARRWGSREPVYRPVGGVLDEVGAPGVVDAGDLGGVWLLYRRSR